MTKHKKAKAKAIVKKKIIKKVSPPKAKKVAKVKAVKPSKKAASKKVVVAAEAIELEPKMLKLAKDTAAKYKKLLLDLRDHLIDGVSALSSDNLKRSNRDASGELSGYSLHMADAGTDNFDREFALSLVSSEQDALYEIEEALKRLEYGTYGLCEICEKPVRKERLEAVPFTRMCVICQSANEKDRRRPAPPVAVFGDNADDETEEKEDTSE